MVLLDDDSFFISKEVLPSLKDFGFVETSLGDPLGSLRQFRNSTGLHAREYEEYFEVHRDKFDPRANPLGHLIHDSPETLAAFGSASLIRPFISKNESGSLGSALGNPLDFFRLFLFFNRFFRILKKLFF
jgi:hypothetical protein